MEDSIIRNKCQECGTKIYVCTKCDIHIYSHKDTYCCECSLPTIQRELPDNYKCFLCIESWQMRRIVTPQTRYEILQKQKWCCNICGKKIKYSDYNPIQAEVAHIDHIHPFSLRDSYKNGYDLINEISNLQALCPKCNITKKVSIQ